MAVGFIYNLITVIVFLAVIGTLIKKGYEDKARMIIYSLVVRAERIFSEGEGKLKYQAVVTWLYERLPSVVQILYKEEEIDEMIEDAVLELKKQLVKDPDLGVALRKF